MYRLFLADGRVFNLDLVIALHTGYIEVLFSQQVSLAMQLIDKLLLLLLLLSSQLLKSHGS